MQLNLIEAIKHTAIYQANGTNRQHELLSNRNYPYLNDNTSSFLVQDFEIDGNIVQKLVMRMLIPKRNSVVKK